MRKKTKYYLMTILLVLLGVLLFCAKVTGKNLHGGLGLCFIVGSTVHLLGSRKKLTALPKSRKQFSWLLLIMLLFVFFSGGMLYPFGTLLPLKMVHKLSAVILILGCGIHIWSGRGAGKERTNVS